MRKNITKTNQEIAGSSDVARTYANLSEPKLYSYNLYLKNWLLEEKKKKITMKGFKKTTLDTESNDPLMDSFNQFFNILTLDQIYKFSSQFNNLCLEDRQDFFDTLKLPVNALEEKYREIVIQRNNLAERSGYPSFILMSLSKYKISKQLFNKFFKRIDSLIDYCNKSLEDESDLPELFYSTVNLPCIFCLRETFPLKNHTELWAVLTKKHPILIKYSLKIHFFTSESSYTFYNKNTDSIEVHINKDQNTRHALLDRLHELCHVVGILEDVEKGILPIETTKYQAEKKAYKKQLELLKEIGLFQPFLADFLVSLRKVLFEIKMYQNPTHHIAKLYAQTFNTCFKKGKQEVNPYYLLDSSGIRKPLSNLPHTVALSELIIT